MSNNNKYCLMYNGKLAKEIILVSTAANAPKRGGGWVADKKLITRASESKDNPDLQLSPTTCKGYTIALNIIIPDGSEITASGKLDPDLMIAHILKALNKPNDPQDFDIVSINGKAKPVKAEGVGTPPPPQSEPQKINYSEGHAKIVIETDGVGEVWSFASNSIDWDRLVEISKEGGGYYDRVLKARKGFTLEKATILAKRHGVALVNPEGLTVVAENPNKQVGAKKQPNRGERGIPQEQRPKIMTPQDLNLYRGKHGEKLKKAYIYFGYTIAQLEDMLCHLLNETRGRVPGKLDTVVSGSGDGEIISITATGNKNDFGSLTTSEGVSVMLTAAGWGVHPIHDMDYWVQSAKKDSDHVTLIKTLNYDKRIHMAHVQWSILHPGHILAFRPRLMTDAEKKDHRVGNKCGYVVDLVTITPSGNEVLLYQGKGVAPYKDYAEGRAPTFYAEKAAKVQAITGFGLRPDPDMIRIAMRRLTGNEGGAFDTFANEVIINHSHANESKAVGELPPPTNDDLSIEAQLNQLERKKDKVPVYTHDDIGGDYYEVGV